MPALAFVAAELAPNLGCVINQHGVDQQVGAKFHNVPGFLLSRNYTKEINLRFDNIIVEQERIGAVHMRQIVPSRKYNVPCLYHAYQSANLFASQQDDVARAVGVAILDDVARYKLPLAAIMPLLGNLVYYGLAHLAADADKWRWDGDMKMTEKFRDWLRDCSLMERRRRVEQLLGISTRQANRFVLLDHTRSAVATDDILEALAASEGGAPIVFDAVRAANNITRVLKGVLFVCTSGGGK